MARKTSEQRFWEKVQRRNNGCLEWIGARVKPWGKKSNGYDYGLFWWNGKQGMAHVFAYEQVHGLLLPNVELDHLCRNRWCVNERHLQPVSHKDNLLRSPDTQVSKNLQKTHCPQGHPYDEENTYKWRTSRICKLCQDAADKRHQASVQKHARAQNVRITICPQGHEYTEDNTYWLRGKKSCRTCNREKAARFRSRMKLQKD